MATQSPPTRRFLGAAFPLFILIAVAAVGLTIGYFWGSQASQQAPAVGSAPPITLAKAPPTAASGTSPAGVSERKPAVEDLGNCVTAPSVKVARVVPAELQAGGSLIVDLARTGQADEPVNYQFRTDPDGAWQPAPGGRLTLTELKPGAPKLEFRTLDGQGRTSAVVARSWTVKPNPGMSQTSVVSQPTPNTQPAIALPENGPTLNHGELLGLRGHTSLVRSVAYSANGKRIASASYDKTVRVWDAVSGRELRPLIGHATRATSVSFSPDGERLVSGSADLEVKVWDAATGKAVLSLKPVPAASSEDSFHIVAFSPDGKRVVSGSADLGFRMWDAATGQELAPPRNIADVRGLAFSPDRKHLALGQPDGKVTVWSATSGERLHSLTVHPNQVTSVTFSADGKRVASSSNVADSSNAGTIKVWDAASGEDVLSIRCDSLVLNVALSPDGKYVATANGNSVKVWDMFSGREMISLDHPEGAMSLAFSPDGTRLTTGVRVWDLVNLGLASSPPVLSGRPAVPLDPRLHQKFAEAILAEPPGLEKPPPVSTVTGKAVCDLYSQVVRLWDTIRFATPDGKRLVHLAVMETDAGTIEIALRPELAPNHVRNFVALARAGYYDGMVFERVVQDDASNPKLELIEGGCPLGTGDPGHGNIGYWLTPEMNDKATHEEGTIGAMHDGNNEAGTCKFYITVSAAPALDGHFTIFGKVMRGLDIARKIMSQPRRAEAPGIYRPEKPVLIRKVTIETRELPQE